jgi:hypothetical protein
MVSTRTFYFETKASNEKLLKELLARWLNGDCRPLKFYKFMVYYGEKSRKISGILQFERRYSAKTLRLCFGPEDVHMDILRPVEKPLILVIMQLWVLAKFYVVYSEYSDGMFSLGGKRRSMHKAILPYVAALKHYKECEDTDFAYASYPGAQQLCQFKLMLYKRQRRLVVSNQSATP